MCVGGEFFFGVFVNRFLQPYIFVAASRDTGRRELVGALEEESAGVSGSNREPLLLQKP